MAGISISGLVSNSFDWKSVVDQLIQIDSAPVAAMQSEEAKNNERVASLSTLKSYLGDLQTSATALSADGLFTGRTAASATSGSTWSTAATAGAANGNYTFAVSQLATAAQYQGANTISNPLNSSDDVSGLTIASLPTATAVNGGTFTVNGAQVTIATSDSLQQVFQKISDATGGVVTASYSHTSDKITLSGSGGTKVVLGAANDSSNFLTAMRLANNDSTTVTSTSTLGSANLTAPLASSRLSGSFGGVDGSGNGTFSVNGVPLSYNINTDSLSTVLSRINASTAGVTATYDSVNDRVLLTNNVTGDIGVGLSDTTGTLLGALGLTSGAQLQHGKNAQFSINGGGTINSTSNVLDSTITGISGLTVTVNTATTQTINVAPDTSKMKSAIQDFITKFNKVQSYIDDQTKITTTPDGKVSTALLADDHDISSLSSQLQSLAFAQVSGLTGTIKQLSSLGIDFSNTNSTLSILDQTKLDSALANKTTDVAAFFGNSASGFGAKINAFVTNVLDTKTGLLATQTNTLNSQNTSLQSQIDTLNKRLADQREQLTQAFIAMQNAQSTASQQQQTLTGMFSSSSKN